MNSEGHSHCSPCSARSCQTGPVSQMSRLSWAFFFFFFKKENEEKQEELKVQGFCKGALSLLSPT